jgi:hypothetical protein
MAETRSSGSRSCPYVGCVAEVSESSSGPAATRLLKRAIDTASEKRGVRMRVNEGPSIRASVVAKASSENEREKDGDASVPAQSSSRERARADKDPDVPASQGASQRRLERATLGSRKRKTVAVLAGGRPFGSRKSLARHGAGGGNGLGHGREKRRLASKRESLIRRW